jgi:hypothetical protein
MTGRLGASTLIGAVCLGLCLAAGAIRADAEETVPVRPFTSLDLRYSPGETYVNFSQVRGNVIFPSITYQQVSIFNSTQISVGAGYQVIQQPGLAVALTLTGAVDNLGNQWIEPGIGIYWNAGRLTVSASGGYSIYLNSAAGSSAAPIFGVDPIELSYQLDDHWTVGLSGTSFVAGQPVSFDILPFVRYDTGHGYYELGLDNLGPGFSQEIYLGWAAYL